jgi:hypothetical protein
MGNILLNPNGIKSGRRLMRTCDTCGHLYESWSDDTMTIKGAMRPSRSCASCDRAKIDEIIKDGLFAKK